jgi:hypothetical protein
LGCRRGPFLVTGRLCQTIPPLPANQTLGEEDIRFICTEIAVVLGQKAWHVPRAPGIFTWHWRFDAC